MTFQETYDRIHPVGFQRLRMYGLPQVHKENIPMRPIVSMIGFTEHELGRWLTEILTPVLGTYSGFYIPYSCWFIKFIHNVFMRLKVF